MLRQPRKKCRVHLEGLNNCLRQRQIWRLISKISSGRERADRNQMTVLASHAFGPGAARQLDGTVPGLACLCRCAGVAQKVLCSTDSGAALQQYHPKRHVFGAEVAMKLSRSLLLAAITGWVSVAAASAQYLPGPGGEPPSKMIECCACIDYHDVQTGCDNRDCPACPVHRQSPSLG